MRRILCTCLVGSLLGSGVTAVWSQDRIPMAGRMPTPFAPVSVSKSPQAAPTQARKSYYAELFGSDVSESSAPTADAPPVQDEPFPDGAPAADAEPSANARPARAGTLNMTGRAFQPTTVDDGGVIRAQFERNPTEAPASEVMQVGGRRIVRPARHQSIERSALTEPINIPGQGIPAEPSKTDVRQLFEVAPAPPIEEAPANVSLNVLGAAAAPARPTSVQALPPEPTAPSSAPNIRVEWKKRGEVSIGRECRCELMLENEGATDARNLEVIAAFSQNVRLLSSEPDAADHGNRLVWQIDALPAGGKKSIQIMMVPLAAGEITTQAEVRFSTAVSGSFQIAEPKLALQLDGPPDTMIGESASQTIMISNPGTGIAGNVQISAIIPTGLEHARGEELLMDLGALHPGEVRRVRLPLAAISGGQHIVQVRARADGGLVEHASHVVNVVAPQLTAAIDGPSLRYLGRRAAYTVLVANDGTVPSENVRVMHKAPEGFKFVSADHGGQFDSGTQLLTWFVGRLEPGETTALAATFECKQIGQFTHFIRATSDQGAISDAQVRTLVEGTPLLSMSVSDLDDPVETGAETAYEVEIKNEGSAAAKRVQLTCELPETMALINVSGPTAHRQAAGIVSFAPIEQLKPGQSVKMRVHVRSSSPGNLRFRAQLTSESVPEPLIEEELTKFYGE